MNSYKLKNKSFYPIAFISIILIILSIAGNISWLIGNESIKGIDVSNHLTFSVEFLYDLARLIIKPEIPLFGRLQGIVGLFTSPLLHSTVYHPNLVYSITSIFYAFLGRTLFAAKISNLFWLIVMGLSIVCIGKKMLSTVTGVLACGITFMFPLIFESLRQYGLDLPLTAVVALFMLLLMNNNFSCRKYSLELGIVAGIGMLIKGQLLFFISAPVIYNIYKTLKNKTSEKKIIIKNIILFVITGGLIAGLWWAINFFTAFNLLLEHFVPNKIHNTFSFPLSALFIYIKSLIFSSIGLVIFIFLIPATYAFFKNSKKHIPYFILWLIIPLMIFSFHKQAHRWPRYLMPILPAIALIISWWIVFLKNIFYKSLIISVITLFLLYQYAYSTFASLPYFFLISKGTNYQDMRQTKDVYRIESLINFIGNYIVSDRKTTVLTIRLTSQNIPEAFDLRYRFLVNSNKFNLIDFTEMGDSVLAEFNKINVIVFQVPSNIDSKKWPNYEEFTDLTENIPIMESGKKKLYQTVYKRKNEYKYVKTIPTELGDNWIIFIKKTKHT